MLGRDETDRTQKMIEWQRRPRRGGEFYHWPLGHHRCWPYTQDSGETSPDSGEYNCMMKSTHRQYDKSGYHRSMLSLIIDKALLTFDGIHAYMDWQSPSLSCWSHPNKSDKSIIQQLANHPTIHTQLNLQLARILHWPHLHSTLTRENSEPYKRKW